MSGLYPILTFGTKQNWAVNWYSKLRLGWQNGKLRDLSEWREDFQIIFIAWVLVTYGKCTIVKEEPKAIYKLFRRRRKQVKVLKIDVKSL